MMGGALGLAVLASLAASRTETLTADGDEPPRGADRRLPPRLPRRRPLRRRGRGHRRRAPAHLGGAGRRARREKPSRARARRGRLTWASSSSPSSSRSTASSRRRAASSIRTARPPGSCPTSRRRPGAFKLDELARGRRPPARPRDLRAVRAGLADGVGRAGLRRAHEQPPQVRRLDLARRAARVELDAHQGRPRPRSSPSSRASTSATSSSPAAPASSTRCCRWA